MKNRILGLKNKHLGEKVVFFGTGTSLTDFDLTKLDPNIITFGFNRFIPFCFEFWPKMKLDYFMCNDPNVFQNNFYDQFKARVDFHMDEKYDTENEIVKKWKKTSTADYIIKSKIYKETKIIFSSNISNPHGKRFGLKQNKEWMATNESEMECRNFMPYLSGKVVSKYVFPEEREDGLFLRTFAKNSFCNSALPILFYMGFSEIYLMGVDYDSSGYFFCQAKKMEGFKPKETNDFNFIMNVAENLPHKPKIYSVKHNKTKICGKDGWTNFYNLTK